MMDRCSFFLTVGSHELGMTIEPPIGHSVLDVLTDSGSQAEAGECDADLKTATVQRVVIASQQLRPNERTRICRHDN